MLDIGCGWAELLLRVLERAPDAIGEGVDLDAVAIAHGQALADSRGLTDRVDLRVSDALDLQGGWDRVVCIGASQVWGAPVEELQPLPYAAALAALRALVPRGGRLVYGDGIWSRPPTPAAVAPLAGRDDEFRTLGEVAELAVEAGFAPLGRARGVAGRVGRLRVRVRRGLRALAGRARRRRPRGRRGPRARRAPADGVLLGLPRHPRASATWSCWRSRDSGRTSASVTNRAASWPV